MYGKRKCRRERKYMSGKGREMWKSTLEEGPGAGMLRVARWDIFRPHWTKLRPKVIGPLWT